jgi:HTH-type transcriptional regulator/antitoxin HigA
MTTNTYSSDLAIHVGEFLEETLEEIGMTQSELANRLGRPLQMVNEIIKGKKSITSTTALELEDVLGIPSHIWLGLENQYQIVLAKQKELELMQKESKLISNFPYADLVKNGFVKTTRKAIEKVDELKRFFEVAKLAQIPHIKTYQPAFRVSTNGNISHEAIASWIQAGRLKAKEIQTDDFDKKKLKKQLQTLKDLMNLEDINKTIKKLQTILNSCGVALVLLPHFKNTKVNGATFWLDNNKAVVLMSSRGGFSDVFWFSFFHEIGHILLHPKREVFLEDGYNDEKLQKQEDEADNFAREILIKNETFKIFVQNRDFTKEAILRFAKQQNIKPSIIVGRLMHEKIIDFNHYELSTLRDRYKWI